MTHDDAVSLCNDALLREAESGGKFVAERAARTLCPSRLLLDRAVG